MPAAFQTHNASVRNQIIRFNPLEECPCDDECSPPGKLGVCGYTAHAGAALDIRFWRSTHHAKGR